MEIWDILDGNGNLTGKTIVRGETLKEGEYHLAVHIWIVNDKGEFLIQKRADNLELLPGMWAATGGSAVSGEDSITAALRELQEELGIRLNRGEISKVVRIKRKDSFADVWLVKANISLDEVTLQKEEVSAVAWVSSEGIKQLVKEGKFHNYGNEYFQLIFKTSRL